MSRKHWIVGLTIAIAVVLTAGVTAAALTRTSAGVALPTSMASTGDSITRGFDLDALRALQDSPKESWSTGGDPNVGSHYDRVLTAFASIGGHAFNDAKTGAKMADLDGQVKAAAAQKVQYLTILMGANDLCTKTAALMTPTAVFEAQFAQALADFFAADPSAHVFVSSIPNIFQLWNTLRTNFLAQATWALVGICQSMLAMTNTDADRQKVVAQEQADNAVLAKVCQRYANCRWDGGAVYGVQFSGADVSTFDYFHPSLAGQKRLAAVTWAASYWPATP